MKTKKVKVAGLSGAALDWAVCMAKGLQPEDIYVQKWGSLPASLFLRNRDEDGKLDGSYTTGPDLLFSRKWEAMGPIIERVPIQVGKAQISVSFVAYSQNGVSCQQFGNTPLIAAARCYVASKLGEEVEVPEELV